MDVRFATFWQYGWPVSAASLASGCCSFFYTAGRAVKGSPGPKDYKTGGIRRKVAKFSIFKLRPPRSSSMSRSLSGSSYKTSSSSGSSQMPQSSSVDPYEDAVWEDDEEEERGPDRLHFCKQRIHRIRRSESQLTLELQKGESNTTKSSPDVKMVRKKIIEEMSVSLRKNLLHARQCLSTTSSAHRKTPDSSKQPWEVRDRWNGDFLGY